jgi:hypothetical protein
MMSTNERGILTTRWTLAVDGDDRDELAAVMRDIVTAPDGIFGVMVDMAAVVRVFAQEASGDDWRAALTTTINILEIEDLDDDDLEQA